MTRPMPQDLREALARALSEHDDGAPVRDGNGLDARPPDPRALARADALLRGPLAALLGDVQDVAEMREELRVLRRQRMAPDRERELLDANNRMLERLHAAEEALAEARRERDVAREAEAFWQHFAFDADDLATRRLVEAVEARGEAERTAIRERTRRERMERALRLFADRADVMPKEGWVSDLVRANRDLPLWWFHAARVALDHAEPADEAPPEGGPGA